MLRFRRLWLAHLGRTSITAHDVMRSSPALGMVVSVCVVGYIRVPWQPTSETVILFLPRDDDLPEEEETVKKIVGVLRSPSA